MICVINQVTFNNPGPNYVIFGFISGGIALGSQSYAYQIDYSTITDEASLWAAIQAAVNQAVSDNSYPAVTEYSMNGVYSLTPADIQALIAGSGPKSYQTIVSQTGSGAPAVSGSLTPTSTYPSGTTFTWARTSAGVYTLTASVAVFNTSGKTGVFVGGLNNLNAQWKAVVTSSTVITFTFAVQSLAVLGLLGFTATPTDGLLSGTMVYIQSYS